MPQTYASRAAVRAALKYNHKTGSLTWRTDRGRTAKTGDEAGYIRPDGHIVVTFAGRTYPATHLIWLYMNGELPPRQLVLHDTNKQNLVWTNIRLRPLRDTDGARYQRWLRAQYKHLRAIGDIID